MKYPTNYTYVEFTYTNESGKNLTKLLQLILEFAKLEVFRGNF